MNTTETIWPQRRGSSVGSRLALVLAAMALASPGCKPNVDKLEAEAEAKKESSAEGAAVEYKAKLDAKPNDPVAMYLYALVTPDGAEQERLTRDLTTKHPDFAWGHFLAGRKAEGVGDLETASAEAKKAGQLEPTSKKIKEWAASLPSVTVVKAGDESSMGRLGYALMSADSSSAIISNLDLIEKFSGVSRTKGFGFEALGLSTPSGEYIIVAVALKNLAAEPLTVERLPTCFTAEGWQLQANDNWSVLFGRDNGLASTDNSGGLKVQSQQTALPNRIFAVRGKPTRCVFAFRGRKAAIQVNLP